ncbi:GATA transcription factor [Quillaja saponaria]|uniref:GATA transcription factor n=1 Tax=Quillaja saponaria TaxID=32244 RepID=A0AAD7PEV2_QUISA|nr:GATA transcription factor [Quillaja saponaria]
MHHCSTSTHQENMVGPCSCGLLHQSNSFSMYSFMTPSVDCTLSLGTPSTRLTEVEDENQRSRHKTGGGSSTYVSNFCWDFLKSKQSHSESNNNYNSSSSNVDPLLARRCANCDTTSTPLWRNGPRGPKSLCNACGIRFKKEERRASATAATTNIGETSGGVMESQHVFGHHNSTSWYPQYSQNQKIPCLSPTRSNEFRFVDNNDRDDNGIPFLSWRLNVTDRPSLVHNFTR